MRYCKDDATFLHEPRALWTVQRIEAPASAADQGGRRVRVDKDHFRNVSRYPITLTHLCVAAINYTFREWVGNTPPVGVEDVHNSAVVQNLVKVYVTAPYSMPITRKDMVFGAQCALPTAEPSMRPSAPNASGLWGVSRWTFDRPMRLPRTSNVQYDLASYTWPDIPDLKGHGVYSAVQFEEEHTGMLGGNSRLRERQALVALSNDKPMNALFEPDGFGAGLANIVSQVAWHQNGLFPSKTWKKQETSRGQDWTSFTGYAVLIDQIDYDQGFVDDTVAPYSEAPLCPLSMRVGTRARLRAGGSGEWWWRPGAPLCLVTPTMTPAVVYRLPMPVQLGPGEELEVEVEAPPGPQTDCGLFQPEYQVGLSMVGWASIEGAGPG